jgi:SAM-dependent methyltransferase
MSKDLVIGLEGIVFDVICRLVKKGLTVVRFPIECDPLHMKHGLLSISYRRKLLDKDLTDIVQELSGTLIDLGGENRRRRGSFQVPKRSDLNWICVNIDPKEAPEIVGHVCTVPLCDACADAIICTEVLEHLLFPQKVVGESYRLLRPRGVLIMSMPFLYQEHGDSNDYQRFTSAKLVHLLDEKKFTDIRVQPQGYYFTVLSDMLRVGLNQLRRRPVRWGAAALLYPLMEFMVRLDSRSFVTQSQKLTKFSTGYFIRAVKSSPTTNEKHVS